MSAAATIHALLVEDSRPFAEALQRCVLDEIPVTAAHAETLAQALDLAGGEAFDVVLLDLSLPDCRGPETVARMHAAAPQLPIVVITAQDDDQLGVQLLQRGAEDYLAKDWIEPRLLLRSVRHAMERHRLRAEREEIIARLDRALAEVKQLSGLLPICSHCKRVRDDDGYWNQIERYIGQHSEAQFSHGICPGCMEEHYGDFLQEMEADSGPERPATGRPPRADGRGDERVDERPDERPDEDPPRPR